MTAESRGTTEQAVYDEIAARNPLGRIPPNEACAGAILFLLSPLASEITGATLDVNGGEFMPS
jgi:NAD(P)-dependent dehydrogenase (short-subunit alcohol dehydrogenase family)